MNSVLQIFKTLYPDSFEDALNNNQDDPIAQAGQALIDVIKDDQKTASKEEAEAFLAAIEMEKDSLGLGWKDGRSQQDAQELLIQLSEKLNFPMATLQGFLTNPNTNEIRKLGPTDPWSSLQVHLLSGDSEKSMQNLLDNYFALEPVVCKWNDTDSEDGSFPKKTQVSNLNNLKNGILPIQVKRFVTTGGAPDGTPFDKSKIQTLITKPSNLVIAEGWQSDSHEDISYTLVAFIEHRGSTDGGHYVSYAKKGDQWTLYNDSNATQVTTQEAEEAAERAYIYFYKPAS